MTSSLIRAAGAVIFDESRRLLVIERRWDPSAGLWSIPGGKCRSGETAEDAVVREVYEESALRVTVVRALGEVRLPFGANPRYSVVDYLCAATALTPTDSVRAGDDAARARWVSRSELLELPTVPGLVASLTEWGVLPD